MDDSKKWTCGILLTLLAAVPVRAMDVAAESALPRVGTVTSWSASPDGSTQEETGNCLLWTVGGQTYTLSDLHTVMAGDERASARVADRIEVRVGKRSSPGHLVWPPEGQRDPRKVDIAILELKGGVLGQPFGPEAFHGPSSGLPKQLYLAAPGHRSRVLPIEAKAVRYGPQWFIYREVSPGDSGGLVYALENGQVVPYGFVSAIGSLPGESARGTVIYGREAIRFFIDQFLQASDRMASRP